MAYKNLKNIQSASVKKVCPILDPNLNLDSFLISLTKEITTDKYLSYKVPKVLCENIIKPICVFVGICLV